MLGVLGTAVLLATAYLVVTLTYHVEHGDTWNTGAGATYPKDMPMTAVHQLRPGTVHDVAITVANPGSLPVALDDVTIDSPDIAIDAVGMVVGVDPGLAIQGPTLARPFQPMKLTPGGQVLIWLTLRLTGTSTYPPCSGFILENPTVSFSVLGLAREQQLPLRTRIMFQMPC